MGHRLAVFICSGLLVITSGCLSRQERVLTVYSGRGLKLPVAELIKAYEKQEQVVVNVVYAGSHILLKTIKKSKYGDIFIPGSEHYLEKGGSLIVEKHPLALHVPAFFAKKGNEKNIKSYADLLKPGVTIGIANHEMATIGWIAEQILSKLPPDQSFRHSITSWSSSNAADLFELLNSGLVDAALIWSDQIHWERGDDLHLITIPAKINYTQQIGVGRLSTSGHEESAKKLFNYIATKGEAIFKKHGFGVKP